MRISILAAKEFLRDKVKEWMARISERRNFMKIKTMASVLLVASMLASGLTGCGTEKVNVDADRNISSETEVLEEVKARNVKLESFSGDVILERESNKVDIFEDMNLQSKDTVTTGEDGSTTLLIDSDKHVEASALTSFTLHADGSEEKGNIKIELLYGYGLFKIDNKLPDASEFSVTTPNATMSVRGTEFSVEYYDYGDPEYNATSVMVLDGVVEVKTNKGIFELKALDFAYITDTMVTINGEVVGEGAEEETIDFSDAQVGDVVTFHGYKWDVLDANDETLVLFCQTDVEYMAYDYSESYYEDGDGVYYDGSEDYPNWENCKIREYLNGEFYNKFTSEEKKKIQLVTNQNISSDDFLNTYYPTGWEEWNYKNSCGPTEDYVYLMSIDELEKYYGFEVIDGKPCVPSLSMQYVNWWLRTECLCVGESRINGMVCQNDSQIPGYVRPMITVSR